MEAMEISVISDTMEAWKDRYGKEDIVFCFFFRCTGHSLGKFSVIRLDNQFRYLLWNFEEIETFYLE